MLLQLQGREQQNLEQYTIKAIACVMAKVAGRVMHFTANACDRDAASALKEAAFLHSFLTSATA